VKRRYGVRLPAKVLMADYDDKEGDLYIRFQEGTLPEGEPSSDGLIVVYRDKARIVGLEVLNLAELS
jgi:hypothetical protein